MYRYAMLFSFSLVFFSCELDEPVQPSTNLASADIPAELAPHFESFQREAAKYGLEVDYASANVTAEIYDIDEGSVAGSCTTNGHTIRHITIDQSFWSRASHLTREMVIFHELGHCILARGHTESAFQNGICTSIMRSGLGDCADAYTTTNRDYFVEELFTVRE